MLEVWWVRHAITDWNIERRWQGYSNVPLNSQGREQATRLASQFANMHFDSVWSSDLARCAETARLAKPDAQISYDKRLREMPMGIVEGKTWDELTSPQQKSITDWWKSPYQTCFPGSNESLTDVMNRVKAWRQEVSDQHRVLCFTHGGIVRALVWEIVGPPLAHHWTMELGNTGIVRVRYNPNCPVLLSFNDVSHLESPWLLPPSQNVPGA